MTGIEGAPERKFQAGGEGPGGGLVLTEGRVVSGYASLFGRRDQGGDMVLPGAYAASLAGFRAAGRRVKMLWQHDPGQPIGVWEEVREDRTGLFVRGRLLEEVARGREAAALLAAGAIDGLSIGYRTVRAERDGGGQRRLAELELWEVSLVTFPMLAEARVGGVKAEEPEAGEADRGWRDLAAVLREARLGLAAQRGGQAGSAGAAGAASRKRSIDGKETR